MLGNKFLTCQDEVANTSRLLVLMQPPGPLSLVPSFAMMSWDVSGMENAGTCA